MYRSYFIFLLVALPFAGMSQDEGNLERDQRDLIQFSGLVLTADSLEVLPFVTILNERDHRGTYTDLEGYFTLIARKGDTLRFLYIGYKTSYYIVPDTLSRQKYTMVKLMTEDTAYLDEAVIRALPTRELFDFYFVHAEIPDDDSERARRNLELNQLKDAADASGSDGIEMGKRHLARQAEQYYYAGQLPPNNLLNPFAWKKFFEAWERGDFKIKKED